MSMCLCACAGGEEGAALPHSLLSLTKTAEELQTHEGRM